MKQKQSKEKASKAKRKEKRMYHVAIYEKYSTTVYVNATSATEAQRIAWEKFKPKRKNFNVNADRV